MRARETVVPVLEAADEIILPPRGTRGAPGGVDLVMCRDRVMNRDRS